MAWMRMCGQQNLNKNFPWDAKVNGGFDSLQKTAYANGSVTFETVALSPKITNSCILQAEVSSVSVQLTAYVSTNNGTTWQQVGMATGATASLSVNIGAYANNQILIRLIAKNTSSATHQMTLATCRIVV